MLRHRKNIIKKDISMTIMMMMSGRHLIEKMRERGGLEDAMAALTPLPIRERTGGVAKVIF